MTDVLYPWGYQRYMVTMDRLKQLARFDLLEPEMAQRMEAWLRSRNGEIGIGGSVRFVQPDRYGFAPDGKSFHQLQKFHTGLSYFCAFDVVVRNGDNVHRAPRWDEVPKQGTGHADIRNFGVHANVVGEPWHIQPIEIDGWQAWADAGRPHPNGNFPIKTTDAPLPSPTPTPTPTGPDPALGLGSRTLRLTSPTMRGHDVMWAQNALRTQGLVLSADGYYGRQTADRVKTWQARKGLTADGIVGPKTWAALIDLFF